MEVGVADVRPSPYPARRSPAARPHLGEARGFHGPRRRAPGTGYEL